MSKLDQFKEGFSGGYRDPENHDELLRLAHDKLLSDGEKLAEKYCFGDRITQCFMVGLSARNTTNRQLLRAQQRALDLEMKPLNRKFDDYCREHRLDRDYVSQITEGIGTGIKALFSTREEG